MAKCLIRQLVMGQSDTFGWKTNKRVDRSLLLMPVGSKWEIYIPRIGNTGARGAGNDIAPYSRSYSLFAKE